MTVSPPGASPVQRGSCLKRKAGDLTQNEPPARKAKQIVESTGTRVSLSKTTTTSPQSGEHYEAAGNDNDSLYDDYVDAADMQANKHQAFDLLSDEVAIHLQHRLRQNDVLEFVRESLVKAATPLRAVGSAFGIDPNLPLQDSESLGLLGRAMVRRPFKRQKLMQYNTIDDAATLLRTSSNILILTGSGISTSVGIPDFRSKHSGFYSSLEARGFTEPEDVFDLSNFDADPRIFYSLAGELLPPSPPRYSPVHAFIRLLQIKRRLLINYTQNIDNLEQAAGIDGKRVIHAHGSWAWATCRKCYHKVRGDMIFDDLRAKRVSECIKCIQRMQLEAELAKKRKPKKSKKPTFEGSDSSESDDNVPQPGVMKPNITFFGEQLPGDFFDRLLDRDAKEVDLVIVIGTTLKVSPVSEIPHQLPHQVPHIWINRDPIEHICFDIQLLGDGDTVVYELCRRAGWELEHEMIPKGLRTRVDRVGDSLSQWTVKEDKRAKGKA